MCVPDPRIPDDAFDHLGEALQTLLDVSASGDPDDPTPGDSFSRSLGLDGTQDLRVLSVVATLIGRAHGVDQLNAPKDEVRAGVLGVVLGLLLAQGTGWNPPIPEAPE